MTSEVKGTLFKSFGFLVWIQSLFLYVTSIIKFPLFIVYYMYPSAFVIGLIDPELVALFYASPRLFFVFLDGVTVVVLSAVIASIYTLFKTINS